MDPNVTLEELQDLAARLVGLEEAGGKAEDIADLGLQLAETFHGLDEWMSSGGFKPSAWGNGAPPATRYTDDEKAAFGVSDDDLRSGEDG